METTQTREQELQEKITRYKERYDQLLKETYKLPGLLREAQERADVRRAAELYSRADVQLPAELADAKADRLDAQAALERLRAQEAERKAQPLTERVRRAEREIEELQAECNALRDERDAFLRAANNDRNRATKYQHEANRLRQIHDPRRQAG